MNIEKLTEELRAVLNTNGVDGYLAIPDHILADHMVRTITDLRQTNMETEEWHAGAKRVYTDDDGALSKLSVREREIVLLITTGHRVRPIADGLSISHHTVRNHLKAIYRKLGIKSQLELIVLVKG